MPKYNIRAIYDYDVDMGTIEADSAKEAAYKAMETMDLYPPMLCHQCARKGNLSDQPTVIASNEDDWEDEYVDEA